MNYINEFKQLSWHSKIVAILIWICMMTVAGCSIAAIIDTMGWV